jgi:hypothetical protein
MAGFCCHREQGDATLVEVGTSIAVTCRPEIALSPRFSQ